MAERYKIVYESEDSFGEDLHAVRRVVVRVWGGDMDSRLELAVNLLIPCPEGFDVEDVNCSHAVSEDMTEIIAVFREDGRRVVRISAR